MHQTHPSSAQSAQQTQQDNHQDQWQSFLQRCNTQIKQPAVVAEGRLQRIVGLTLEATGCKVAIGSRCLISNPVAQYKTQPGPSVESDDEYSIEAEVVGFDHDKTYLMPIGSMQGLIPGAKVKPISEPFNVKVGAALLGRVINGLGEPIDKLGPLSTKEKRSLYREPVNPFARRPIQQVLDVGVRAINGLLTIGQGQRMGLFAGSGVGKSVLLGMMTKFTNADVIIVGLIGERGREVNEFITEILGEAGRKRAVVVAVPADESPLLRLRGAVIATTLAEYFRDQGQQVLLLVDSLTRYAQAQREIALAIGEPPATKGYPPSVFTKLPALVERAGNTESAGSMTAIYTVLTEGDDHNDPVADAARAVLDGHVVLRRAIAEAGRYPAIDIEASISRVMNKLIDPLQLESIRKFRQLYSCYEENKDLINLGVYSKGSNPAVDAAIDQYPELLNYLAQSFNQGVNFQQSRDELMAML